MSRPRRTSDERGAVLITVAAALPVFLVFAAFVIDLGNWYVHKRHLQKQADASALAAAGSINSSCATSTAAADTEIKLMANKYGGGALSGTAGGVFNGPLKQTSQSDLLMAINAANYPDGQSKPNDTDIPSSSPCAASMIDVKMTEKDLGGFFGQFSPVNPIAHINAQARVSIKQLQSSSKSLPISAIEPDPKTVQATLFDASGKTIGTANLNTCTSSGGLKICDSSTNPLSVTMDNVANGGQFDYSHMTVRITLSGSTSTTCSDQLVACYDSLLWVRGWSDQPTVGATSAPRLRGMPLVNVTCSDAYFTDGTACLATLRALVDFQPGLNLASDATVSANVPGTKNAVQLAPPAAAGGAWTATVSIPAGATTVPISLDWVQSKGTIGTNTCTTKQSGTGKNKNPCFGSFDSSFQTDAGVGPTLQQPFSATPAGSGPLTSVAIGEKDPSTGVFTWDEDNLQRCSATFAGCTHKFIFRVAIAGTLQLSEPTDPPVALRVVGNETQTVDCDPNVPNLKQEIELPTSPTDTTHGCHKAYTANTGQSCPNNTTTLWNSAQPWPCVAVATGGAAGQLIQGLNQRLEGDEMGALGCPNGNHWPNYANGDPRIVPVFVTPFGSFKSTGGGTVPVIGLAFFYITGWSGTGGNPNPCIGNDNVIAPGNQGDRTVVSGHFIKYVEPNDPTNTGGGSCDLTNANDVFGCVAVLTK